jgi:hypothetical protein
MCACSCAEDGGREVSKKLKIPDPEAGLICCCPICCWVKLATLGAYELCDGVCETPEPFCPVRCGNRCSSDANAADIGVLVYGLSGLVTEF